MGKLHLFSINWRRQIKSIILYPFSSFIQFTLFSIGFIVDYDVKTWLEIFSDNPWILCNSLLVYSFTNSINTQKYLHYSKLHYLRGFEFFMKNIWTKISYQLILQKSFFQQIQSITKNDTKRRNKKNLFHNQLNIMCPI